MTDFERFSEYWEQAVNGLAYRIGEESSPILPRAKVQAIWQEELLDKRFLSTGVKHGARVFLDELEQNRPEVADQVIRRLKTCELPLGVDESTLAGNAAVAAVGLFTACVQKLNILTRATSLAVGGTFAVKTAQNAMEGTKGALMETLEKETARQLLAFKALLEDATR